MKKTSCVTLGVIWFGAAVSVAEIEAGAQSGGNWPALVCGHLLGGALLFAAGLIGARTGQNAMETAADAFGKAGGRLFASLNVLQLVGWTAVMVSQGAVAVGALTGLAIPVGCVALAALVAAWLFAVTHDKFHLAAMGIVLLAALAAVLTFRLGALPAAGTATTLGFWPAFEISVAMPLSWLPLVSDYTRDAHRPVSGTATAVAAYTVVSVWMYALGMLLARCGAVDLAAGITKAGVGVAGLAVVVFSTMTTTFLDAYSSGESVKAMLPKARPRVIGVTVCALGAVLATSGVVSHYIGFLCLIASVFAPMAAVVLACHYAVRRPLPRWNFAAWLAGFAAYHLAGSSPVGPTLAALAISAFLAALPCLWQRANGRLCRCGMMGGMMKRQETMSMDESRPKAADGPIVRCAGLVAVAIAASCHLPLAAADANAARRYERDGFPASYATRLAELHARHPAWTFKPIAVHDMDWESVVDKECTPGWNLVVRSNWAAQPWTSRGIANYAPYYDPAMKAYDSGAFYQASREAVAYFMDPRNFLNDTEVFMFETLGYNASAHGVDAVEAALAGSFMQKACHDGSSETFAALLHRLGERYGISPVFLAGRLTQEQGNGSVQSHGAIGTSLVELYRDEDGVVGPFAIWGPKYAKTGANTRAVVARGADAYDGYYNFFNIKACGTGLFEIRLNAYAEATEEATVRDYGGPWTSQERAIAGGVKKMKEIYVDTLRHTRYLQKYSVCPESPKRWSQYMQNVGSPIAEARATRKAYVGAGTLDAAWRFVIPVYRAMPAEPCPDPAGGASVYSPTR